ncbi:MAG: metalloprotease family protein [Planctomycetota bacterium]|nr:metalloprotease family protein [Planctomycetota bacterium]
MPLFIIPGSLVSALTFPGVIVHEAAHLFFCRRHRVAVFDVCFFRFGNPAGYVIHEPTNDFRVSFAISLGPFLINSLVCVLICSAAFLPVGVLDLRAGGHMVFYWLGLSIGMHAFPSSQDLANVKELRPAAAKQGDLLAKVSAPLLGLLGILDLARFIWADYLYGLAIGVLLPLVVFKAIV